jgi:manganese/zinc/iron transport system ATP- binding protein
MLGFAKRQISQLSGGQQQRVFLARALAQQGELFLMDEPFAGVDVATEELIIDLLKDMKSNGKTLIIVHHDLHTAQSYFDHLVLMNTRLVACGKTSDVFTDQILTDTYGGKLTTIAKISQELENKEFPIRHR